LRRPGIAVGDRMTGGHAVSAVAHAVRDDRGAAPGQSLEPVAAGRSRLLLTATRGVARLTDAAVAVAAGEHSEHYREPSVERSLCVAAGTVATCRRETAVYGQSYGQHFYFAFERIGKRFPKNAIHFNTFGKMYLKCVFDEHKKYSNTMKSIFFFFFSIYIIHHKI